MASWGGPLSSWPVGWGGPCPRIIRVGSTRIITSIQSAIDLVASSWGTTPLDVTQIILLDDETFIESLNIPSSILSSSAFPFMIKPAFGRPIIDATGNPTGVLVEADGVHIIGTELIGMSSIGIHLLGVDDCIINSLSMPFLSSTAILIDGIGSNHKVLNNQLHVSDRGIKIDTQSGSSNLIAFNSIYVEGVGSGDAAGIECINTDGSIKMNVIKARADKNDALCLILDDAITTLNDLDRNVYFVSDGAMTTGIIGRHIGAITPDHITLANWQTEIGKEANSASFDPLWKTFSIRGELTDVVVNSEVVIEDTSKDFIEDEHRSKIIKFLTGVLAGDIFIVRINTSNTLTLQDADILNPPSIGDDYVLISGEDDENFSARPRITSPLIDTIGTPISETNNDIDGNIRDGVSPTPGSYESKNVSILSGRSTILEILGGLSSPLDTVFGGRGGAISRFIPGDKLITDTGLIDDVVSTPIKEAAETLGKISVIMALGIDNLFPDQLLDSSIDFLDEIALGTENGQIVFLRSDQEIPLDSLSQITTEVTMNLEFVRV